MNVCKQGRKKAKNPVARMAGNKMARKQKQIKRTRRMQESKQTLKEHLQAQRLQ